jgi:uncharacterized protein
MIWDHLWLIILVFGIFWLGHACLWTYALNNLYGRKITKKILKPFRLLCGVVIVFAPLGFWLFMRLLALLEESHPLLHGMLFFCYFAYGFACAALGGLLFPVITLARWLTPRPAAVRSTTTRTINFWRRLGQALIGNGKWAWVPRLPGSCVFTVDFTTVELRPPGMRAEWDGLQILLLSDLHFHGTPSRVFFDAVMDEILTEATPDLVLLAGDFVDTDTHHEWIAPVLGRLQATLGRYAILGNHDLHHHPAQVRQSLQNAGFTLVHETAARLNVRGHEVAIIGHEGPWFAGPTGVAEIPAEVFRILLSHSPDNICWASDNGMSLMFSGHVHGGQIRLPIIGSIFVPSIYSRRYDQGVFQEDGTTLIVSRGLSGKEPLRYNCHPQVVRVVLRA